MTTVVKALGGPKKAAMIVGGGLLVTGGALYAVISLINQRSEPLRSKGQVFTVLRDGETGKDLTFQSGDRYRVLERDGDAVLVEVIGRTDNPHFVSGEFLATISDFPAEETEIV